MVAEEQVRFRTGRSTIDQLFIVHQQPCREVLRMKWNFIQQTVYNSLRDLKQAKGVMASMSTKER